MSRLTTLLILAALSLLPVGCSFLQAPPQMPLADYPFHYNRSDFKTAWKIVPSKYGVPVELMLKNVRYAMVNDLTLEVSLIQGDQVAAKRNAVLHEGLGEDEYGKLAVDFKRFSVSPGDLLHFSLRYNATDQSTTRSLVTEFTVDAVTGVVHEDRSSPDE